jgi:FlaA1/EpsC-like NDP-sugar epimerase
VVFHISLSSTFLRNRIVRALHTQSAINETHVSDVPANIIFIRPTLNQLTNIMIKAHDPTILNGTSVEDADASWAHIDKTIEQYTVGLKPLRLRSSMENVDSLNQAVLPTIVLLTGSTGNLGSYLLSTLVHQQNVNRIYCLNRRSTMRVDLAERQKKTLGELGLDTSILSSPKVVLLEGDVAQDRLGLENDIFEEVIALAPLRSKPNQYS